MDRLTRYREIIQHVLLDYVATAERAPLPEVETLPVFDTNHDEFIVRDVGWLKRKRVRTTLLHLRIRGGKIWIEEDWTESGIATALLADGVPNEDIVLAFQPPELRPHTEFAVA